MTIFSLPWPNDDLDIHPDPPGMDVSLHHHVKDEHDRLSRDLPTDEETS